MALRRKEDGGAEKWLEVDASMTGTLAFKDPVNLQINGRFEGTLDAKGVLAIGEKAQVRATIQGDQISIGGVVDGTITATGRVELLPAARVTGKIITPRLVVQDGAILQGTVEMSGGSTAAGRWMGVEDLARYLEVDSETVTQWAQAGRMPAQRENGQWRFERAKVEEWLAQARVK